MGGNQPDLTATRSAIAFARDDLASFATLMHRRFELTRHHRLIIEKLESVERREIDRLMLALPPRHGKSLIASEIYPAWFLGRHPDKSVIATSYGSELAVDFGRKVRNHMASGTYKSVFPTAAISPDSSAAHRFNLMTGGAYFAVGSGGSLTGRGSDVMIIDDPIKNVEDANSATFRKNLHDWYESVAYTRLQPGGAVVIISTRWHQDDLCGWLLNEHASEGWTTITLPAIAEPGDALGRAEGAALWPAKFPIKTLNRIREAIGGAAWASLYQQRPAAAEGAIFRREWWRNYSPASLPPRFEEVILSLDTAFKTGASSDYSVALVLGVGETGHYVLDVWRGRAEFPKLKAIVAEMAAKWRPDRVLIEDAASGQSLIQELRTGSRLAITPVKVSTDKISRSHAITPMIEAGRVFLPEQAPWLADFLDELSSFPAAAHDDQTDSLTQALNYIRESPTYSNMIEIYKNQTAVEVYRASAHYGMAAQQSGLSIPEVEALVADTDEMTRIYEEELNRLQSGSTQSYTYGNRPDLTTSIQQALADIQRGK